MQETFKHGLKVSEFRTGPSSVVNVASRRSSRSIASHTRDTGYADGDGSVAHQRFLWWSRTRPVYRTQLLNLVNLTLPTLQAVLFSSRLASNATCNQVPVNKPVLSHLARSFPAMNSTFAVPYQISLQIPAQRSLFVFNNKADNLSWPSLYDPLIDLAAPPGSGPVQPGGRYLTNVYGTPTPRLVHSVP